MPRVTCESCGQTFSCPGNLRRHQGKSCPVIEAQESKNVNKTKVPVENKDIKQTEIRTLNKDDEIVPFTKDVLNFKNFSLVIDNKKTIKISVNAENGYIDVTQICQAAGKRLSNWKQNKDSEGLLNLCVTLSGIQDSELFRLIQVGKTKHTFAHPDIAIQIAQWCSPDFALQVSRWTRELLITGKVEINNEKSNEELQQALVKVSKLEQEIERIFNPIILEFSDVKTKPANYLIMDQRDISNLIKYGEAKDMLERIKNYKTQFKGFSAKIISVVYFEDHQHTLDLEKILHMAFKKFRRPNGSEWLEGVEQDKAKLIFETMYNGYCLQFNDEISSELIITKIF